MDIWPKAKRSEVMSRIRSKDTKVERTVRSLLHSMGYRFRLHRRDLPGNPDIILPKHRTIILVHGCFWHLHHGCRDGTIPKTHTQKWKDKLEKNVRRDRVNIKKLQNLGWKVILLWECEVESHINKVAERLRVELKPAGKVDFEKIEVATKR